MTSLCFHCDEPVPHGCTFEIQVDGTVCPVCCAGCQAVAEMIIAGGQSRYYRFRTQPAPRVDERALSELSQWEAFDGKHELDADGDATLSMLVEGIHCGACAWLIETRLGHLPGMRSVDVDVGASVVALRWCPTTLTLSDALGALVQLGFTPHPLEVSSASALHREERADLLRRLAVSGLGMMQVMMFAVATYAGAPHGIDPAIEHLLVGVSMVVATPVVFFSGAPFLTGVWRALRVRTLSMDVPIALALLLAYGASCLHFFSHRGDTYFESVSMFVFFLLCARLIAMQVRHRSLDAHLALASLLPDVALRVTGDQIEPIPRAQLEPGDLIRIRPGDAVPADGQITDGESHLNEALLSGEATPHRRAIGDTVMAGSINVSQPLTVRVAHRDAHSRVAKTAASLGATRARRPRRTRTTERIASRFVAALLAVAVVVGGIWLLIDPSRALGIVLAVLVVTCPCALSLALPTARSAAAARLANDGVLVNDLQVFDTLDKVTVALFDKTGTLTLDRLAIDRARPTTCHPDPVSAEQLVALVAGLESHSAHPIASAFAGIGQPLSATDVRNVPGHGLCGRVDRRQLRVGTATYAGDPDASTENAGYGVFVSDEQGCLGFVGLRSAWRDDAASTVKHLRQSLITCCILSGDDPTQVAHAVHALGLDRGTGHCLPEEKLARLRAMQQQGEVVMAVGDGINDAAFLAGADVSIAVASGADLAQAAADVVLTGRGLQPLAQLPAVAQRVRHVARQNLTWAVGYNALAVPLAALGLIGPGLAALGMSLSSLIVVLNSARLTRTTSSLRPRRQRHRLDFTTLGDQR